MRQTGFVYSTTIKARPYSVQSIHGFLLWALSGISLQGRVDVITSIAPDPALRFTEPLSNLAITDPHIRPPHYLPPLQAPLDLLGMLGPASVSPNPFGLPTTTRLSPSLAPQTPFSLVKTPLCPSSETRQTLLVPGSPPVPPLGPQTPETLQLALRLPDTPRPPKLSRRP